jgi:hypothetical protein
MLELAELIILSLATWRLSYLIVYEDAPFHALEKLREWNDLGGLLRCIYCVSIWVAVGLCWLTDNLTLVNVLAVSGLAVMWWRYTGGEHG